MRVHPAIAALRSDPASQRQAGARMAKASADWHSEPLTRALAADLERYGSGAALSDCTALAALFADHGKALDWVGTLSQTFLDALAQEPLGDVPFRASSSARFASVRVMSAGRASLSLCVHEALGADQPAKTVLFEDSESLEMVLVGSAKGVQHRLGHQGREVARITSHALDVKPGDKIRLTANNTRSLAATNGAALILQLTRIAADPKPTCKYRLDYGVLLETACGDKQSSRLQMALAVLGALEHRPALEVMEQVAMDAKRDSDLRWEAVRQSLALDPATGFRVLSHLALRQADALAHPAARLRDQLIAAHPQLAQLTKEAA